MNIAKKNLGSSFYVYLVVTLLGLAVVIYSLTLEYWGAKFLPLVIGSLIAILAAIGVVGEAFPHLKGPEKASASIGQHSNAFEAWKKYGIATAWLVGLVAGIYVVGFMLSTFLFLLLYMWSRKVKLLTNIIATAVMLAAIYIGFGVLLKIELPKGLILTWLGL